MHKVSVHISYAKSALSQAEAAGLDRQQILLRSRIPEGLLDKPNARISATHYVDLIRICMHDMNDELLGYTGNPVKSGAWAAMCHWIIHAKTLAGAIARISHFFGFMERGFQIQVAHKPPVSQVTLVPWSPAVTPPPYAYEQFLFVLHRLLCWLAGEKIPITRVQLPYPRPDHASEYTNLFLAAPVTFDHQFCTLQLSHADCEKPIVRTMPDLKRFLRNPLLSMLTEQANVGTWTAKVRQLIAQNMAQIPTFEDLATQLDIHPKKLSRQLKQEGISYIELKSQLRRDIAIYYLSRAGITVEEVAEKTGFSEASAFIRAFKQWTGVTPYTYRKGLK